MILYRVIVCVLLLGIGLQAQTWTDQSLLAANTTFIARVEMSSVRAAISIINELPTTLNHTNRILLCQ
jgi:hypothetical protein